MLLAVDFPDKCQFEITLRESSTVRPDIQYIFKKSPFNSVLSKRGIYWDKT